MIRALMMMAFMASEVRRQWLITILFMSMMAKKKKEMPANTVAVVTGASRGTGRAIALALADAGCKVIW